MSRRRRKQRSQGRRGNLTGGTAFWIKGVSVFLVILLLASGVLYMRVRSYIHSDEFRDKISKKVSVLVGAEGEFGDFVWSGMHGKNEHFRASSDGALVELEGSQIDLDVTTNLLKRENWEISDVRIGRGNVVLDLRKPFLKLAPLPEDDGWLASMLPKGARLHNAEVGYASAVVRTLGGDYGLDGAQLALIKNSEGYEAELSGGQVTLPLAMLPTANLRHGKLRYLNDRLQIDQLLFDVHDLGELDLYGEVDFSEGGTYKLSGRLAGLRCGDVVNEDWKKRLSGELDATFNIIPQEGLEPEIRGRLTIKNGELTALPILDHIASFTMERDFRRLKISKFECNFRKHGDVLMLSGIKLVSDRLIRIEGNLEIRGEKLNGSFQVGLNPGTLGHIPGAEEKIFISGKDGMGWTTVKISGTGDDVKEDLSERLIAAAGERMFEMIGGKHALKLGGETLENLTGIKLRLLPEPGEEEETDGGDQNLINQGKEILNDVSPPVKSGADLIERGLQGIFGGEPESDDDEKKK